MMAKPVLCDTCQGLRCRCCGVLQDWSDSWSPVAYLSIKKLIMKVLTLSIKQEFFDQIKAGTKTFEEREIRPNNVTKYCVLDDEGYVDEIDGKPITVKYDAIKFLTGAYKGKRPSMLVEVKDCSVIILTDEEANDIIYLDKGEEYIASIIRYELGEILEQ
jgi:hypothetical protein